MLYSHLLVPLVHSASSQHSIFFGKKWRQGKYPNTFISHQPIVLVRRCIQSPSRSLAACCQRVILGIRKDLAMKLKFIFQLGLLFPLSLGAFAGDWKYNEKVISETNTIIRTTFIESINVTVVGDQTGTPILSINCSNKGDRALIFIPGGSIKILKNNIILDYLEDNDRNPKFKKMEIHANLIAEGKGVILFGAQALDIIKTISDSLMIGIRFQAQGGRSSFSVFSDISGIEEQSISLFNRCDL